MCPALPSFGNAGESLSHGQGLTNGPPESGSFICSLGFKTVPPVATSPAENAPPDFPNPLLFLAEFSFPCRDGLPSPLLEAAACKHHTVLQDLHRRQQ